MAFMEPSQLLYTVLFVFIIGLALVSLNQRTRGESSTDVMNIVIILVLRAMGRHSDVRRGDDEHSWARHYYAIVLIHSCSRL